MPSLPQGEVDESRKVAPKLKRDDTGKLIVTYRSPRLLKPKQHDSKWRKEKLAQYNKQHEEATKSGKKSLLGYFTKARSSSTGDAFIEAAKIEAKLARGVGTQMRGGTRSSRVPKASFGKFITNASGDPYLSPSQIRAAWKKKQKAKNIHSGAFASGKRKSKMVTNTFTRPRFLSEIDGDEDLDKLKQKINNAKVAMASTSPKFNGFKGPNFITSPSRKGGPGVANTTLPLYEPLGQDKLKRQSKYIESPYDAARVAEVERHKQTEAKVKAIHGDDAKPFISRVSRKGVDTFSKIKEVFGEDKQTKKMIEAKFAKMNKKLTKTDEEEEAPPQWKPSSPPKKMIYADKKAMFGGSNLEYVADPVPEFQADAYLKKKSAKIARDEELTNPAWVPNGSHSHGHKGTSSVCHNPTMMRHQIYKSTALSTATAPSAGETTRR